MGGGSLASFFQHLPFMHLLRHLPVAIGHINIDYDFRIAKFKWNFAHFLHNVFILLFHSTSHLSHTLDSRTHLCIRLPPHIRLHPLGKSHAFLEGTQNFPITGPSCGQIVEIVMEFSWKIVELPITNIEVSDPLCLGW